MKRMKKWIIFPVLTALIGLSIAPYSAFAGKSNTFSLMTYNLENLYDYTHDEGTKDYSYLPLSYKQSSEEVQEYCNSLRSTYYRNRCLTMDWNRETVYKKLRNIARVIKVSDNGKSPDILVLQEVENVNILKLLLRKGLPNEGYRAPILIEGPDRRGIDVAILSKLPLKRSPRYHQIDLSDAYDGNYVKLTRGILEARFSLGGKEFAVLANHWPSQRNPDETRVIAAKVLLKVVKSISSPIIVAGDFNTMENDEINPINELLLSSRATVPFWDVEKVFFGDDESIKIPHRGTHHYNGEWSSLDRVFVPKSQSSGRCRRKNNCLNPIWDSYRVVKLPFMLHDYTYYDEDLGQDVTYYQIPMRYNPETGEGFSDHLPAMINFELP